MTRTSYRRAERKGFDFLTLFVSFVSPWQILIDDCTKIVGSYLLPHLWSVEPSETNFARLFGDECSPKQSLEQQGCLFLNPQIAFEIHSSRGVLSFQVLESQLEWPARWEILKFLVTNGKVLTHYVWNKNGTSTISAWVNGLWIKSLERELNEMCETNSLVSFPMYFKQEDEMRKIFLNKETIRLLQCLLKFRNPNKKRKER